MICKISLTSLLITNFALGLDAQYLSKGSPAPFEGYILTVPKAKEVRQSLIEKDGLTLINDSLQKSLDLQKGLTDSADQRTKIVSDRNDDLAKELASARSTSNWERIFWFTLGVVGMGAAVYAARQITH